MTIQGLLPRLIVGKAVSTTRMLEEIENWEDPEIESNFNKVPDRYSEISGSKMTEFTGLNIFAELIKFLKEQPDDYRFTHIVVKAQREALHYHNVQFKTDDQN